MCWRISLRSCSSTCSRLAPLSIISSRRFTLLLRLMDLPNVDQIETFDQHQNADEDQAIDDWFCTQLHQRASITVGS